jgi:hypothetical protein
MNPDVAKLQPSCACSYQTHSVATVIWLKNKQWSFINLCSVSYFPKTSRPVLGPTKPPVQWVPGFFSSTALYGLRPPLSEVTGSCAFVAVGDWSTGRAAVLSILMWPPDLGDKFSLRNISIHARKILLHAVNLRHGTDGFTSPPKEVVLRIFITLKNRTREPWVQWRAC